MDNFVIDQVYKQLWYTVQKRIRHSDFRLSIATIVKSNVFIISIIDLSIVLNYGATENYRTLKFRNFVTLKLQHSTNLVLYTFQTPVSVLRRISYKSHADLSQNYHLKTGAMLEKKNATLQSWKKGVKQRNLAL